MLTASPLLLRALLAVPPVAAGERHEAAGDQAPAPVLPSFALVAAGYGIGPLRGQMPRPRGGRKNGGRKNNRQQ